MNAWYEAIRGVRKCADRRDANACTRVRCVLTIDMSPQVMRYHGQRAWLKARKIDFP
jgi:hypothetical protein